MYDTDTPNESPVLNTAAAAKYLGLSTSFMEKARLKNSQITGPKFKRAGSRILYLRNELDAYLESSD